MTVCVTVVRTLGVAAAGVTTAELYAVAAVPLTVGRGVRRTCIGVAGRLTVDAGVVTAQDRGLAQVTLSGITGAAVLALSGTTGLVAGSIDTNR